jgi:hypothetical protein
MLILAFLGMIVNDTRITGAWDYWKWVVPIYALLALWLSWYTKEEKDPMNFVTLRHELFHWIGLIGAIFLVSYLVHLGTISRFIAGIFNLILLSLGIFLAGIYIESTFILVGIVLAIFALLTAALVQYMYVIVVPVLIGAMIILGLLAWLSHKKTHSE